MEAWPTALLRSDLRGESGLETLNLSYVALLQLLLVCRQTRVDHLCDSSFQARMAIEVGICDCWGRNPRTFTE